MKEMISDFVWGAYRQMQRHYITFRLLIWLKERGIMRSISYQLWRFNHTAGPAEEDMRKSRKFFSANEERVKKIMSLLADEKSKIVLGGGNSLQGRRYSIETGLLF